MNERPSISPAYRAPESKQQERERHKIAANAVLDAMAQGGRNRLTDEDSFAQQEIEAILERVAQQGQRRVFSTTAGSSAVMAGVAKELGVPAESDA